MFRGLKKEKPLLKEGFQGASQGRLQGRLKKLQGGLEKGGSPNSPRELQVPSQAPLKPLEPLLKHFQPHNQEKSHTKSLYQALLRKSCGI